MIPDYQGQHLAPYMRQFNMEATNTNSGDAAVFRGYAAGPWYQGYPVNYVTSNNFGGLSVANATDGTYSAPADTTGGNVAADAGFN